MTTLFLFTLLIILLLIGVPVAIALGLSSVLTILFFSTDSLASLSLKLFQSMEHYTLLAIPFFILSAGFLSTGGVAKRIIRFAIACVGSVRGGMAMASVLACMLFAAVSGSSPATVVAIGSIVIAGMVATGYTEAFAVGVVGSAGTLGILIPPSIVMVVYAAITEVSVGRLFVAGIVPGLLAGLMLMIGIYGLARKRNLPKMQPASWVEILDSGKQAIWGLLLIVIVIGGIYSGIFTATEAAAVAAVYAFLIAVFLYRDLKFTEVPKVLTESGKVTIMLMFIITNAMLFGHVLTTEQIPQQIAAEMINAGMPPWLFLIVVNVLLLIGGSVMEPSGLLLIVAPILFPIATQLGIDPIHLGIIMVVNMEVGMITPPVGLNLFVLVGITEMNLVNVIKAVAPWLVILLIFLMMITYIPAISLFLPDLLFGPQR
ncbi:MAG: C4-dicarboxylate ABC transporter permease [Candidatus Parabeggiatoa sp. nov. 3]|nr:MAG: C4-dicarboxylate ABC transporter permease [Gammaproteobacteria bacterium]RKZ68924.1 MAG: C4-dicarboxylate ABC transporter permease [Gammaproteobacteria bacterium]RKZ83137.1 MAG: C4-dicarboxylate ABC transporter permease [Gammaproteobacteria bacterium]